MSTTPTPKRKHVKHNTLARVRHGAFNAFLAAQATAKTVLERGVRDALRTIKPTGLSPAGIRDAANASAAGVVLDTVTLSVAQRAAVTPTNLSFGRYVPDFQSRNLKFGAASASASHSFVASTHKIHRATGSFVTDGFQVGAKVVIVGSVSNAGTYTVTVVAAGDLTVSESVVDESAVSCTAIAKNTIVDTDGISLAAIISSGTITVTNSSGNDKDYTVNSASGAVLIVDNATTPVTTVASHAASILVDAGTIDYGLAISDTVDFSRYAGTITFDASNPSSVGFQVGGNVEVKGTVRNNGRYKVTAVSSTAITVARATTGSITVTFTLGAKGQAHRSSGSFLTDGFQAGDYVSIDAGAADASNRAVFKVLSVTASDLFLTDLPASETNDSSVTISTVHLTDEVDAAGCTVTMYDVIKGFATANLVAGANFQVSSDFFTLDANGFNVTVASVPTSGYILVTGYEFTTALNNRDSGQFGFVSNVVERAAGDFEDDGFTAGEMITIAAADADNVDGQYTIRSTADTKLYVATKEIGGIANQAFRTQVLRDTNATLKGNSKLTRSAGSWATTGFGVGALLHLTGTVGGTNDGQKRVKRVVSTTVIEVQDAMATETTTASVKAYLVSEKAR